MLGGSSFFLVLCIGRSYYSSSRTNKIIAGPLGKSLQQQDRQDEAEAKRG